MNRKQIAYRIIAGQTDALAFDIDCGCECRSKEELVERTYKFLLNSGTTAQHFKFLTAERIKQTITDCLEKACRKWGVEIK